ncbi:unnamed protein product, partial [Rotaria sp. Silwood1]
MLSNAVIALLPSEREINRAVNKARRAVTPTIPTTQLFDLPDFYTKALRNNDFLKADKFINRRQRIILFGSHEQLKMLFSVKVILMDALQMKLDFSPKIIMSDLESGLASAVKSEFTTAKHSSCYFHFTQAVYRNIQQLRLSSMYNDDDNVKLFCRKLMALPLLPKTVIEDVYDDLIGNLSPYMRTVINDLLEYFQRQWFLKVPISQWCVHGSCIRTNNDAEGTRTQKPKTIAIQHRIENLTERYNDGLRNIMEYLVGLSL